MNLFGLTSADVLANGSFATDHELFALDMIIFYIKCGEFGGEAMMESVTGAVEFVDFDNEEVRLRAYEYLSRVLRQGFNRDDVVISLPQIILEVNTFFHLVFVCILPQKEKLGFAVVDQEAVGSKGKVIAYHNFFVFVIFESSQLHAGHRAPNR